MRQQHVGNDSSGESSPWVGICVIDGHLPRVFHGLAPSPPLLSPPLLSLFPPPPPPSPPTPPLPSPLSEQECRIGSSHSVSHSVSQLRTFLHRAGVNN